LGVTVVAYVSKWVAAWITARIFKYTKNEFWTVYGLSHAQAAVTIPTLVIGLETGLFDATLFNAAILMILLTSITSPLLVQRFGKDLQTSTLDETPSAVFARILVPIIDPRVQERLVGLATLLAKVNEGKTIVVNIVQAGREAEFALQRDLLGRTPEILNDPESEIELIPRLAETHGKGILFTSQEQNSSLILMGWRGKRTLRESLLGSVLDEVIWGSDTPVMVAKLALPLNGTQRVLFVLPPKVVPLIALRRMLEANLSLAKALNVPLEIHADASYQRSLTDLLASLETDHPISVEALQAPFKAVVLEEESVGSFIVVPGFGSRKRVADTLGNLPEQLAAAFDGNLAILHFDK
jgi:nucleotide-binding universal stress UspA family protein